MIGAPGVGNYKDIIPLIKNANIKKFIIAYDMDSLKKEDSVSGKNEEVFKHLVAFAKEVIKISFDIEVVIWTWNIKDAKGLDDLLLSKKLPVEIDLFTGEHRPVQLDEIKGILKPTPKGQPLPVQKPTAATSKPVKVAEPQQQEQQPHMEKQPTATAPLKAVEQPKVEEKKKTSSDFDFSCFASESNDNEDKEENNSDMSDHAFI
ncbi:hypothetical protein [Aneurinibacillus tyrosinisolvens]|uniref:hypothetical protein n=1 Tax=Aneurinibacillus tyrosinisolvens TaxID=1443435 RepID=UPI00063F155D|nr:hypothetical protein [Aneurinibacillus tyrosinisolvens]